MEDLLHKLSIDIVDDEGERHAPREWFIVPLNTIECAVGMILNGDIINYRFDKDSKVLSKLL